MFTGIITDIGTIVDVERRGDLRVRIATRYDTDTIDIGASIACSGACLTVVHKEPDSFSVDISAESASRTPQGRWQKGQHLNLERALKVGDELGGHIVTGHVDGVGTVAAIVPQGDSKRILITVPKELAGYLAPKGSITVDGVSLTVNEVEDSPNFTQFSVNIIPHTAEMTTLGELEIGAMVNIEIDVLARYLFRMKDYQKIT